MTGSDVVAEAERALGRLTIRWAMMEQALGHVIILLYRNHNAGAVKIAIPDGMKRRRRLFVTVVQASDLPPHQIKVGRDIGSELKRLSDLRNGYVHSSLAFRLLEPLDPLALYFTSARFSGAGEVAFEYRQVLIGEIERTSDQLLRLLLRLYVFGSTLDGDFQHIVNKALRERLG